MRVWAFGMCAVACGEAPSPQPLEARIVAIDIEATPPLDTLRPADSVLLTVAVEGLTAVRTLWAIGGRGDTIDAPSLQIGPGIERDIDVTVIAAFGDGRLGVSGRRFTAGQGSAPTLTLLPGSPVLRNRMLGDTVRLVAEARSFGGQVLQDSAIRWFHVDGTTQVPLGVGTELVHVVGDTGTLQLMAVARDAFGSAVARWQPIGVYDPVTRPTWIVAGSPMNLGMAGDALAAGGFVRAYEVASGAVRWETSLPRQPLAGAGGDVLALRADVVASAVADTLTRILASGVADWTVALPLRAGVARDIDGSIVIGAAQAVRRVSDNGNEVWRRDLPIQNELRTVAIMRDGTIVVAAIWSGVANQRVIHVFTLSAAGAIADSVSIPMAATSLPQPAPGVVVVDDSTAVVVAPTNDSLVALAVPGLARRWSLPAPGVHPVVDEMGVLYVPVAGGIERRDGRTGALAGFLPVTHANPDAALALDENGGLAVAAPAGSDVTVVDRTTGTERFRARIRWLRGHPVITPDGWLVVAGTEGLYAWNRGVGPASSPWPMLHADPHRTRRAR